MPDIYGILNMGARALLVQQKAIDVTGHNIANVNTPGYSRQRVNMETRQPISFGPGQMGTGVKAGEIQRIYDRFVGTQINNENRNLGKWEAQKETLERVEMVLDETTGYGLNQAMSEFFNAWQDLSNNPSGQAERTVVLAKSEKMADNFKNIYSDLEQIQKDMNTNISGTVDEINSLAQQIADLNQKISQVEVSGQNSNDYRDKRDLLLNQLSMLIDINTFEDDAGKVTVLSGNGNPLVENITSWSLTSENDSSGSKDIFWVDAKGNRSNITSDISGGKLKGWLDVRDVEIPEYLSKINTLADSMITQINSLHSSGFGLDGSTGNSFFTGSSASDMAVNQDIVDNINMIAASESAAGVPGDNSNAIAIVDLQSSLIMNGNTATFDGYYNALVSSIGSKTLNASINHDHQTAVVTHLSNYRESISGVSLDEEMVNLIKFQHAYDAAAKLISTVDELLNTIINMA